MHSFSYISKDNFIHLAQDLIATLEGLCYLLIYFNIAPVTVSKLSKFLINILPTFRAQNSHASEVVVTLSLKPEVVDYLIT